MSYILEGLKKLEQKRQQEKGSPDLLTFQTGSPHKAEKRPLWPYLLFAVLLLTGFVFPGTLSIATLVLHRSCLQSSSAPQATQGQPQQQQQVKQQEQPQRQVQQLVRIQQQQQQEQQQQHE